MRTFGNGNKGRSGPNAGKGRPEGNRFSGGRKPSPAGDGTGFRKRADSGRSDGDSSHKKSFGAGGPGRGEDRPFNRSYGKPFEKSSGDSSERPYRSRPERESGDSTERPYRSRPERGSDDTRNRTYGGRSERSSGGSGDRPFKKFERKTGDSHERPSYGRNERSSEEKSDRPIKKYERRSEDSGDRPYRGRAERPSGDSGDRPFKRTERGTGESFDKTIYSKNDRNEDDSSERPFGRAEKPSRPSGDRPYRARPERKSSDTGDRSFKRSEKSFRDYDNKPKRTRVEKPEDESSERGVRSDRAPREASERTFNKPSRERDGKSKTYDRTRRESSDRPHRQSGPSNSEHIDDNAEMRINKYIANCGYCSRREADTLIAAGAVKVNGIVVSELGSKVMPIDKVQIGDVTLSREVNRYVLLNKPKGYITTSDDPFDRKTVMTLVTNACRERIYPVGRLDRNTSGLLLFTNDGDLAKKLTHPKYGVRKVYHVGLDKALTKNDMLAIADGIKLEDGDVTVDEIAYVNDDKKEIGIELHSGQNRVVRRIFESLGYEVEKLDRVVFANLTKKDLARGRWRLLEQHEINTLKMSL